VRGKGGTVRRISALNESDVTSSGYPVLRRQEAGFGQVSGRSWARIKDELKTVVGANAKVVRRAQSGGLLGV
jgi:hypothetical protein